MCNGVFPPNEAGDTSVRMEIGEGVVVGVELTVRCDGPCADRAALATFERAFGTPVKQTSDRETTYAYPRARGLVARVSRTAPDVVEMCIGRC